MYKKQEKLTTKFATLAKWLKHRSKESDYVALTLLVMCFYI